MLAYLVGLDETANKFPRLILDPYRTSLGTPAGEFCIGRHKDADCLLRDVNISRRHAEFKFKYFKNVWTVKDNNSTNSIKINGTMIPPAIECPLADGDIVTIGQTNDYVWRYEVDKSAEVLYNETQQSRSVLDESIVELDDALDKLFRDESELTKRLEESRTYQRKLKEQMEEKAKKIEVKLAEIEANQVKLSSDLDSKGKTTQNYAETTIIERRLRYEKDEITSEFAREREHMLRVNQDIGQRIQDLLVERSRVRTDMEERRKMQKDFGTKFDEQMKMLNSTSLKVSRSDHHKAIEKLNAEYAKKLKVCQHEMKLRVATEKSEKERMELQLKTSEEEVARLNEVIREKKRMQEEAEWEAKRAKTRKSEEAKMLFLSKCSDELKCPVCEELFIEPMTLGCGHVYCQYCISQWQVKCEPNSFNCPNCRKNIDSFSKAIHLNNLILLLYNEMSKELKEERQNLIQERNEAKMKRPVPISATSRASVVIRSNRMSLRSQPSVFARPPSVNVIHLRPIDHINLQASVRPHTIPLPAHQYRSGS